MSESVQSGLVYAEQVRTEAPTRSAPSGILYATFGDIRLESREFDRMVGAVPKSLATALHATSFYFVPLAMGDRRSESSGSSGHRSLNEATLIAPAYTPELSEQAICHRNVSFGDGEAIFISTRLLNDRFALSFEFFINIGHTFVDLTGVPDSFAELAWNQALADIRGETSQDGWESRKSSLVQTSGDTRPRVDEKAKSSFVEAAFSDAIAIYLLSLALDFDYSELREREYPLLAPQALAERLRHISVLFPPNPGYEFAIRYRRRA